MDTRSDDQEVPAVKHAKAVTRVLVASFAAGALLVASAADAHTSTTKQLSSYSDRK